ncbi:MAG: glycerol-3-phosphate 1-O-acyltransferase PlsY [Gammaproteobacteria bacterium]|nr:glycerol-3-phosphate 1-O-acyltransferase PlsY [Gammaproteobacteria bacterium]MCW8986473.1 glycerol-3-phosphate 1-O-acyltransferase PlsY [Gammaproteobacteria bacterium]MCW9030692.1 glycerol-3-phosphate 1-O-acyltransferase PlsY [Gammaproteobacteria bacterium]
MNLQIDMIEYIAIFASYLIGSLSSAIIVCKIMSLPDPRGEGSGNPGATNVLRFGGKKAAAITLAGDMLKGLIPVLIVKYMGMDMQIIALVGLAAFLGHLYPVFFQFKGGKGVATMLGVMFGFSWWVGLATAGTWLFMAKIVKISSLSALVATLLAPVYVWLWFDYIGANSIATLGVTIIMTIILFWRHRSNIQNLLSGKEEKIGTDKA